MLYCRDLLFISKQAIAMPLLFESRRKDIKKGYIAIYRN